MSVIKIECIGRSALYDSHAGMNLAEASRGVSLKGKFILSQQAAGNSTLKEIKSIVHFQIAFEYHHIKAFDIMADT